MLLNHQVVHSGGGSVPVSGAYALTEADTAQEVAEGHAPLVAGDDEGTDGVVAEARSNNGKGCVRRRLVVGGTVPTAPSEHGHQRSNTGPVDPPRRAVVETAPTSYQEWSSSLDDLTRHQAWAVEGHLLSSNFQLWVARNADEQGRVAHHRDLRSDKGIHQGEAVQNFPY